MLKKDPKPKRVSWRVGDAFRFNKKPHVCSYGIVVSQRSAIVLDRFSGASTGPIPKSAVRIHPRVLYECSDEADATFRAVRLVLRIRRRRRK